MGTTQHSQVEKRAFTLAEVLITLGIIGIVAALTLPNLIASYRGLQYRTAFKKTLSVLSQAATLNKAKYGFDYSGASSDYMINVDGYPRDTSIGTIAEKNINGAKNVESGDFGLDEYNVDETSGSDILVDAWPRYLLPNGILVGFPGAYYEGDCHRIPGKHFDLSSCSDTETTCVGVCIGFIDVNGPLPPNKEVSCSTGTTSRDMDEPCTINDKDMGDVFPVVFYDSVAVPATNAARAALQK